MADSSLGADPYNTLARRPVSLGQAILLLAIGVYLLIVALVWIAASSRENRTTGPALLAMNSIKKGQLTVPGDFRPLTLTGYAQRDIKAGAPVTPDDLQPYTDFAPRKDKLLVVIPAPEGNLGGLGPDTALALCAKTPVATTATTGAAGGAAKSGAAQKGGAGTGATKSPRPSSAFTEVQTTVLAVVCSAEKECRLALLVDPANASKLAGEVRRKSKGNCPA